MPIGEIIPPRCTFNSNGGGADPQAVEAARAQWQQHLGGSAKGLHFALRGLQMLEEVGGVALVPAALAPVADVIGIPAEAMDGVALALTTLFKAAVRVHGENNALEAAGLGQHKGGVERVFSQALSARSLNPFSNR